MEQLRKVTFAGHESIQLTLWDTYRTDRLGKSVLRYELTELGNVLFEGSDFACSPMHGVDSDETILSLMNFLTLRKGDTDREYFDSYTPEQLAWSESSECEALQCDCMLAEEESDSFIIEVES